MALHFIFLYDLKPMKKYFHMQYEYEFNSKKEQKTKRKCILV